MTPRPRSSTVARSSGARRRLSCLALAAAAALAPLSDVRAAAGAARPPPDWITLSAVGPLPSALARELLPIEVPTPGVGPGALTLVDAVYCGPGDGSSARLLATARPGTLEALPAPALTEADCESALPLVAARLSSSEGAPAWLVAATLEVRWTPWRLAVRVADAASAAREPARADEGRAAAKALSIQRKPLRTVSTAGLTVELEPGRTTSFHLAFSWGARRVDVVAVPARQARGFTPRYPLPRLPSPGATGTQRGNLVARLPDEAVNALASATFDARPLSLGAEGGTAYALSRLRLRSEDGAAALTGIVTADATSFPATATFRGRGDLRLERIEASGPSEACTAGDLSCVANRLLLDGAAAGLAEQLSRRYEGVPLRALVDEQRFPIPASARSSCASVTLLGAKAEAGRLLLYGDVTFEESRAVGARSASGSSRRSAGCR
jgi:hypothetical protein